MKQPFYKLLSIVLTLSLLFSCCMIAFNVIAEESETGLAVFYVNPISEGGEAADGLTQATAVPTIVDAINKAKAYDANFDGTPDLGVGDTAYIKLVKAFQEDGKTEIWQELYPDGVTAIPKHDFKLDISSDGAQATIKMYAGVSLQNDTKFTNLIFAFESGKWRNLIFNSHNISFGPNVTAKNNSNLQFAALKDIGTQPNELNYSFESFPFPFYIGLNYGSASVCKTINITLDNSVSGNFILGNRGDANAARILNFDGNMNFNIKKAKSLSIKTSSHKNKTDGIYYDTPVVFTENFAAQFINSTGTATLTDNAVAYFSGKTVKDTTDPVKYFVINNAYGADAIEFTETAGKYKVNADTNVYDISLVNDADTTKKAYIDSDGYITVEEAGAYTLKLNKKPNLSVTYFVGPDGDDSNPGTQNKPFASVNAAIKYANDKGYSIGDKVYVKVISGTVPWTPGSGVMVDHDYLLNISSLTSTRATIGEIFVGFSVNGDVELENVIINADGKKVDGKDNYTVVNFNGQNVKIGKNVTFSGYKWDCYFVNNGSTFDNPINFYIGSGLTYNNTAFKKMTVHNATFDKDIAFTIDNTSYWSGKTVNPIALGGSKTTKFNGNINFNIKTAKGLDISEGSKATYSANTSIQFINSANANLTTTKTNLAVATDFVNEAGNKVPVYIINNNSGNADAISFTETAGKYKFNLDSNIYNVSIVKTDDATVKGELVDGFIIVPEAGEYTFTIARNSNYSVTYFVSPKGNDANSGKTEDEALATIHGVISAANKAGYGATDTVYAKLIKTTVTEGETTTELKHEWYPTGVTTLPEYDFKLDISSKDDRAAINMYYGDGIHLTGNTDFDNVILAFKAEEWPIFSFGSHEVSIGSKVDYENAVFNNFIVTSSSNQPENINLYFGTFLPHDLRLGGMYVSPTFKNINITLNSNAPFGFALGCQDVRTITFDGNLNFNIKEATDLNISTVTYKDANGAALEVPLTFTSNFAAQFINSTGNTALTDKAVAYFSDKKVTGTDNAVPYYVINNNTGNSDAISFTENTGVYNVSGLPSGKSLWVYNKEGEFVKKVSNNSTITLEPGEYDFNIGVGPIDYSIDVQEGTSIAEAIQTAIDMGADAVDTVTLNVTANTTFGTLPEYKFNLIIKSINNKATLTVDDSLIANNPGFTTEYKNVVIEIPGSYGQFSLAHSNVIFHSDVSFVENKHTLVFGHSRGNNALNVDHSQTVVFNCPTPSKVSLSDWLNANKVYNKDVNLIINNKDAATTILFNAYNSGTPHYTTKYNGNVNINIKDAKDINIDPNLTTDVTFGENSYLQFSVDGSTDFEWSKLATKITNIGIASKTVIIIDKTFQRRCVDFTETAGTISLDNPYKVTATKVQKISGGIVVDADKAVKTSNNSQLSLELEGNIWELTTNEYFEDFDDTTLDELRSDWTFTGDANSSHRPTTLTDDGRLLISSTNYVLERGDTNKNFNLKSKEQFISVDLQPKDFGWYNGFTLFGRMNGAQGYGLRLCSVSEKQLNLFKYDGVEENQHGLYVTNLNGLSIDGETDESDGLMEHRPGQNCVGFNATHVYRMGLSITTDYDKNGNEVALIRCILFDITSNTLLFDETFRDTEPYIGTECAMYSPHGYSKPNNTLCYPYVDNFYFSTEKFRDGDDGWYENDINGDGVYDIRDLVFTSTSSNNATQTMLYKADRDLSGTINSGDITIIRKELLDDVALTKKTEFKLSGKSDSEAETTKQYILNSTSSYAISGSIRKTAKYTSEATVRQNGGYTTYSKTYTATYTNYIYPNIYFVSNNGSGDGSSESAVMSFDNFITNYDSYVTSGAIILFKRGETYRMTKETIGTKTAFFTLPSGTESNPVVIGAYGTGAKPKFTSSQMDYKNANWTELGGKNPNVWVLDAPEFLLASEDIYDKAPTNIIFDGGDTVGLRKGFPIGLEPNSEKLYTLYKQGDFTYNSETGKLYLYSESNPSNKYNSIEITRGVNGFALKTNDNIVIDNLNLQGFKFAVTGNTGNVNLTVTNCEIGFSGGVKRESPPKDANGNVLPNPDKKWHRYANAIEFWEGGAGLHVNYNWIYQTWDSAITTQANTGRSHDGMQVKGNLLEYNNCDIEIFGGSGTTRDNTEWTDNIMRFTSLGWGSRSVSRIRDIQGVIRGGVTGCTVVSIDWTNNIVDTPGMEFARFNNLADPYDEVVEYEENGEIKTKTVTKYAGIFKFGQSYNSSNPSELGNNTYYFNPYVRARKTVLWDYYEELPEDRMSHNYTQGVSNKEQFYDVMTKFDNSKDSQFYYLGEKVTSGS